MLCFRAGGENLFSFPMVGRLRPDGPKRPSIVELKPRRVPSSASTQWKVVVDPPSRGAGSSAGLSTQTRVTLEELGTGGICQDSEGGGQNIRTELSKCLHRHQKVMVKTIPKQPKLKQPCRTQLETPLLSNVSTCPPVGKCLPVYVVLSNSQL